MSNDLQDMDFTTDSFDIVHVGYLVFLENFDGDLQRKY